MKHVNNKGFSLIELMIVVAIIGILATVAIPNFQRFQTKARQSEIKGSLGGIYIGEAAFFAEWAQYYGDFRDIGFSPSGVMKYNIGFAGSVAAPLAPFQGSIVGGAINTCFNSSVGGYCIPTATAGPVGYAAAVGIGGCGAGVNPTAGVNPVFTASGIGNIGGAVNDVWTLNQNQTICNNITGL